MTQATKRLFLALWPEDESRRQIHELQQLLKYDSGLGTASPVDTNNIHATLHFLGSVPEKDILALTQALDSVSVHTFEIELDRLGYFSKPHILWLGCTEHYDAFDRLCKSTAQAIKKCMSGYRTKKNLPHVTLFRKAMSLPQKENIESISWHVDSFALVESKTYPEGVQYRVLQQWPLMH